MTDAEAAAETTAKTTAGNETDNENETETDNKTETWGTFLTAQAEALWEVRRKLSRGTGSFPKPTNLSDEDIWADARSTKDDLDLLAEQIADLAMQVSALASRIEYEGTTLPHLNPPPTTNTTSTGPPPGPRDKAPGS